MALTIDQLQIQIEAESGKATNAIDTLIGRLEILQRKLNVLGFSSKGAANSLGAINKAAKETSTSVSGAKNSLEKLTAIINVQKTKLEELKNKYTVFVLNNEQGSEAAIKLQRQITALSMSLENSKAKLSSATAETNKLVVSQTKLEKSSNKSSKSTQSLSDKVAKSISKWRTLFGAFKSAANIMSSAFKESNSYVETLNLFNVTMGDAAESATDFANSVSKLIGIDVAEWMNFQGTFKQLTSGFGVAEESSDAMSKNLTQLSYDLASFFNTDVETAFDKLSSAMAGQVKGLREFGIDTTVASLQEYALAKGIEKSVSKMTQAEKSLLRYNYIMEKSTKIQGDMARTLVTPANAIRVLNAQLTQMKRAFGDIISVLVARFIPYIQAAVEIITDAAKALADFFGFELPTIDYSGLDTGGYAEDLEAGEDALNGSSDAVKKLKKQLMGFDELNILSNPNSDSSGSSSGSDGGGLNGMQPLGYNFLENLDTSKLDEAKNKLKDILWYALEIAAGLLTWKLSKSFLGSLGALSASLGLILIVDSIREVVMDGISWKTVIEGAIGGALLGAAIGFKLGGFPGAIGGIAIGIGLTLIIQGVTSMFSEGVNLENVAATIAGALFSAAGIYKVIKMFNKSTPAASTEIDTASTTTETLNTGTSTLTGKLKNLATNMAWGLLILVEAAAAAIVFAGAIAILGWELEKVGDAWEPVIDNGNTILIALGLGTSLLAAVGLACGLMGGLGGGTLAAWMGIGIAILAEMGVATGLFLAELWGIGWGLEQVGLAWQPVLANGETIEDAIINGTALLVIIGVATAALGAATVASAGLLPLAIGLGTALLVELAVATILFIESLVEVAEHLSEELAPELEELNGKLPDLSDNMSNFTDFMTDFAGEVVRYTTVNTIASIAATIDKIIDFFTTDPVQRMSDEVKKQNGQFDDLIKNLNDCIPDIQTSIDLVKKYNKLMDEFGTVSGGNKPSILTFLTDVVTGVWEGIKKTINTILAGIEKMSNGVITGFNSLIKGLNKIKIDVPDWVTDLTGVKTFGFNLSTISSVSIPRLAEGGFVGEGQMFIAREAGPELVGSIGRKTAVANNDQIISGIEAGVYRAVVAANSGNGGGSQTIRIINEIDGDVVGEKVIQYHNGRVMQTGASPLLV